MKNFMDTLTEQQSLPLIQSILQEHLQNPVHSWSIGVPGAIGEFMYEADEPVEFINGDKRLEMISSRAAIRLDLGDELLCIAHEDPSPCIRSWSQSLSFCLPKEVARLSGNETITCLGEDREAIRETDRDSVLFDLGVGSSWVDFCIRTGDSELIKFLKGCCGRAIFDEEHGAGSAILEYFPSRVVRSKLARVEISTPIPAPGEETHIGPHTHLLPALLNANIRASAALPGTHVAMFVLYPEHPLFDKYGGSREFSQLSYLHFRGLLETFGSQKYLQLRDLLRKGHAKENSNETDKGHDPAFYQQVRQVVKLQAKYDRYLPQ